MVRTLQPWHTNTGKRLIKSPKLYIRDSGIFHTLQSIETLSQLQTHHKVGASWEGFAMESVIRKIGKKSHDVFFWSTHSGAEVDLFWYQHGKNYGVEFKYSDAPKTTKSMRVVLKDLDLEHLYIIYPGKECYQLDKKITVMPLKMFNSGK